MEIVVSSIGDRGNLANERIGFKVLRNCQLKFFLVHKTQRTENGFANVGESSYWFLPTEVVAGDKVVLYTKSGINSVKNNPDGSKTYFFYWGLSKSNFKNDKDTIVLVRIDDWKMNK